MQGPDAPPTQLLVFALDDVPLALPLADVIELVRAARPTPLPGAPAGVLGVLNVRGALVPLLDVRPRLGHPPRALRPSDVFVLARLPWARQVALAVDSVDGLRDVAAETLVAPNALPSAHPCVAGATALPDGTLVILDLQRFLSDDEHAQLEAALDC